MTENNDQKLTDRVRKLLEKARAVAGTPEADVFNAKAFELMAQYGLDPESIARSKTKSADSKLIAITFTFTNFATQRVELLWAIAQPLHCTGIVLGAGEGGGLTVKIFGVKRHIDRVKLLHQLLTGQMLAGASKVVPPSVREDVNERRANWMKGFSEGVQSKINEVEQSAIRQADMNAGDTTYAVARQSDWDRAQDALAKAYPFRSRGGFAGTRRGSGYHEGYAAGRQSDVGQTRVGAGAQRAIG